MRFLKTYFLLVAGLSFGVCLSAQTDSSYNYVRPEKAVQSSKYTSLVYGGFGLGGYYPYSGPAFSETPSLTLLYERTVVKHLGPGILNAGALLSFKGISSGYFDNSTNYNYIQTWNYYIMGARCSYHLPVLESINIDPYAGGMAAFYLTKFKFSSNDPQSSEPTSPGYYLATNNYHNYFGFSVFAGVRSWLSSKASAWFEVGYGYTTIAFGLCYKI